MSKKGITIYFTEDKKKELERMAKETGLHQATLCTLATLSMLENYEHKGSFIFADLLNPEHKN